MLAFIPKWDHLKEVELENSSKSGSLADVWKNKFFISVIPMGLFNYGGLMAIQTLWAGPWMIRVSGYTPLESATGLFWIMTTKAKQSYHKFKFKKDDVLLFGRESAGVPESLHKKIQNKLKIPISKKTRSLNVAMSVAIVAAEAMRQNNFLKK